LLTKQSEIVEKELWDHYSELPNPSWYEYKENKNMNELQDLSKMILELNNSTSTNEKISVLEQYKDNTDVCRLLEYTHSQFKQFNVTPANCEKKSELITPTVHHDIFALLNDLHDRTITGNNAIGAVNSFTKKHPEHKELVYKILNRNLKTRVGTSVINRVIPNCIPVFNVALAQKYEAVSKNVDFKNQEWFASRKLDGVRCITIVDPSGNVKCYSRAGKEFKTLDKVRTDISAMGVRGVVFDGEICLVDGDGNEDFQGIMKQIKRKNHTIENPIYKLFDYITLDDFNSCYGSVALAHRLGVLQKELVNARISKDLRLSTLDLLEQDFIEHEAMFEEMVTHATQQGWEGLMLRKNTNYCGKRNKDLLKVKKFHDAEYTVVDLESKSLRVVDTVTNTEVEEEMLSAVMIEHRGNIVRVGSGFSIEQRREYHADPSKIVGKTITVQYFEESKNQNGDYSLRFPVIKHVFNDGRDV
jgi:DNA ligase 1